MYIPVRVCHMKHLYNNHFTRHFTTMRTRKCAKTHSTISNIALEQSTLCCQKNLLNFQTLIVEKSTVRNSITITTDSFILPLHSTIFHCTINELLCYLFLKKLLGVNIVRTCRLAKLPTFDFDI